MCTGTSPNMHFNIMYRFSVRWTDLLWKIEQWFVSEKHVVQISVLNFANYPPYLHDSSIQIYSGTFLNEFNVFLNLTRKANFLWHRNKYLRTAQSQPQFVNENIAGVDRDFYLKNIFDPSFEVKVTIGSPLENPATFASIILLQIRHIYIY